MFSGLPDSTFSHDGVGLAMVGAGEPRLRHYRGGGGDTPLLRAALARLVDAFRLPEVLRVSTSR